MQKREPTTERTGGDEDLDRREFMKTALTIGGTGALSATMALTGLTGTVDASTDGADGADRRNRQHAWADFVEHNDRGVALLPTYQLLLFLEYDRWGPPRPADRDEMEGALRQIERAFEWSNDGVVFTVGYSRTYFDRFREDLPDGIDLKDDQEFIDEVDVPNEDPVPEDAETLIHVASDTVANLLAVEGALWGTLPELDGVPVEHTFEGLFDRPTSFPGRRTGFVGSGVPREEIGRDDIPEDAPLSMGFESLYQDNVPSEDDVTIVENQTLGEPMPPGVFAQGSIQHASSLNLELDSWYDDPLERRVERMFSPHHDLAEVGEIGDELGETTDLEEIPMRDPDAPDDVARRTQRDAEELGTVGHLQKLARARFDLSERDTDDDADGTLDTTILRRDFNTTDMETESGLHFLALMRFNGYMVYVRKALNGPEFQGSEEIPASDETATPEDEHVVDHEDVDIAPEENGFHELMEATRRGNFLLPPLTLRSLPPARGTTVEIDIAPGTWGQAIDLRSRYTSVALHNTTGGYETFDRVWFGPPEAVNQRQGARPVSTFAYDVTRNGTTDTLFVFETSDLGFEPGDDTARLLAFDDRGEPFHRSVDIMVFGGWKRRGSRDQ